MDLEADLPLVTIKLLLLGAPAAGKSELLARWAHNDILPEYVPTLGIDCRTKIEQLGASTTRVLIWELGGDEVNHMFLPMLLRSLEALVFVFAQSDTSSFHLMGKLVDELSPLFAQLPLFLIATHHDLPVGISSEEGEAFAKKHNMTYVQSDRNSETCALLQAARAVMEQKIKRDGDSSKKDSEKTQSRWCFPSKSSGEDDSPPRSVWNCFRKSEELP